MIFFSHGNGNPTVNHWTSLNIIEHHWTSLNYKKHQKKHVFSSNGANLAMTPWFRGSGFTAWRCKPLGWRRSWRASMTFGNARPAQRQFSGSKDLRNYSSIWSYLLFRFEKGQLYSCWPGSRQSILTKRMVLVLKIYSFWCLRMFEGVHFGQLLLIVQVQLGRLWHLGEFFPCYVEWARHPNRRPRRPVADANALAWPGQRNLSIFTVFGVGRCTQRSSPHGFVWENASV